MNLHDAFLALLVTCMVVLDSVDSNLFSKQSSLLKTISRSRSKRSTGSQGGKQLANFTGDDLIPIRMAVILPSAKPYLFRKELVQPAIEYALETVRSEVAGYGYKFEVAYKDSFCNRRASLAAVDLYYGDDSMYKRTITEGNEKTKQTDLEQKIKSNTNTSKAATYNGDARNRQLPFVFFGPACNEAASMVATFAQSWNVPIITSGAPVAWILPGPEYPTLTRVSASHMDLAYFLAIVFRTLNYGTRVPIHLIFEDVFHGSVAERECHYVMQAMYAVLNRVENITLVGPIYIAGLDFDDEGIIKQIGKPKVVLMCASSDIVRRVMIGAHKSGYTNPLKNVWYAIDLHNSSHYAHGAWKRNDADDEMAKEAYRSLQLVTLHSDQSAKFNRFVKEMNRRYREAGISTQDNQVNEFVEGFHDGVLLYVNSIRLTLQQGIDIRDGLAISRNMRNVTIEGIAGRVFMSESGDRHGDYSILAMDNYHAGTFSKVYDYLGSLEIAVNYGLPKLDLSRTGQVHNFTVNREGVNITEILERAKEAAWEETRRQQEKMNMMAKSTTEYELLSGILGTFGGMLLCCMLICVPMCYHKKRRSRASNSENGNGIGGFLTANSDQICLHRPLREEGSVATCLTTLDEDQKL